MKFNYRAFLAILSLVIVIYFIDIGFYETIMKSNSSYGVIGDFVIIWIAKTLNFPSCLIMTSKSQYYLVGILVNLCLYSLLIHVVLKLIFKKYHK
jgi:hypothetical protein